MLWFGWGGRIRTFDLLIHRTALPRVPSGSRTDRRAELPPPDLSDEPGRITSRPALVRWKASVRLSRKRRPKSSPHRSDAAVGSPRAGLRERERWSPWLALSGYAGWLAGCLGEAELREHAQ